VVVSVLLACNGVQFFWYSYPPMPLGRNTERLPVSGLRANVSAEAKAF
jgi:hypothetical protein